MDTLGLAWPDQVSSALADGFDALVAEAARTDGVEPMSEDVRLLVRPGGNVAGRLLIATRPVGEDGNDSPVAGLGRDPVGVAYLGGEIPTQQAELLVRPAHRGRGVGTAMLGELLRAATAKATAETPNLDQSEGTLAIWAHGDGKAAASLARRYAFSRDRVLWQLRRRLDGAAVPAPNWPAGVSVRTFDVGRDELAWLAVNRRAFAHHPEQGRWELADLASREAQPWFDPAGFFLAEQDGRLVGFHWTKVHPDQGGDDSEPTGEVYVVGVDPESAGSGLGKALTLVGLRHLQEAGLRSVLLYVDDDNSAAVGLYTALGFDRHACDVGYVRRLG